MVKIFEILSESARVLNSNLAITYFENMTNQFDDEKWQGEHRDYRGMYDHGFAQAWDQLVDWQGRDASEGLFFIDLLRRFGVARLIDMSTGTGYHSIKFLRAGFSVVSVDGSAEMLSVAQQNAELQRVVLTAVHADWRDLTPNVAIPPGVDAIVCLGNSFTHLFSDEERRLVISNWAKLLRRGGVLIMDYRNYDALISGAHMSASKLYYCSDKVDIRPGFDSAGAAKFEYVFDDGRTFNLKMYPLTKSYVRELFGGAGFTLEQEFGDFSALTANREPNFFIDVYRYY